MHVAGDRRVNLNPVSSPGELVLHFESAAHPKEPMHGAPLIANRTCRAHRPAAARQVPQRRFH
jgi:hypothetical protein